MTRVVGWRVTLCRRRVRALIVAALAASFVVSATLLLALIATDDLSRLCRTELDQLDLLGHGQQHDTDDNRLPVKMHHFSCFIFVLADTPQWRRPAIVTVRVVHMSVRHANISGTKRDRTMVTVKLELELGFSIQNLPYDFRPEPEVHFRHFGRCHVETQNTWTSSTRCH